MRNCLSICFFVCGALLLILTFPAVPALGQDTTADSVIIESEDTVLMKSYAKRFNPRKALLLATIVPGLGQAYNKKYWKIPLVYGGFAAIGWNINRFHGAYADYREQLFYNIEHNLLADNDENPNTGFTTRQLRSAVDRARYRRDFWIIMMGFMYLIQAVDAHVDAHLKEFDLNPNLRVSVEPTVEKDQLLGRQTGLSVKVTF
jgi:hypothetical protein